MIVVTGAAGFIGSCLIGKLNAEGYNDIIAVDDFSQDAKHDNWKDKRISDFVHRDKLADWLRVHHGELDFIFHLGARTDTTEFDTAVFDRLNLNYSKMVWGFCCSAKVPLIYASSAATYGMGEWGYDDDHSVVPRLRPLNPYGDSKNEFDKWVLQQKDAPPYWAGLKFFNVYGPNEYHKGRMASVVFHAFHQIHETGKVKLFRSHKEGYDDGKQIRDFVYVMDVVKVCLFLMKQGRNPGIFNLGTGKARTFHDLAVATFNAMNKTVNIEFIDMPEDIRDKYQYYTEARMEKLRNEGYADKFSSLEEGIDDYIGKYLGRGLRY